MSTILTIDDGLKTSLGYCDGDDSLSQDMKNRMNTCLMTAENLVQGSIGNDVEGFYEKTEIKPLYIQACNSLASTYYNNPSTIGASNTATIDEVSNAVIGQLRGRYDVEATDGTNN